MITKIEEKQILLDSCVELKVVQTKPRASVMVKCFISENSGKVANANCVMNTRRITVYLWLLVCRDAWIRNAIRNSRKHLVNRQGYVSLFLLFRWLFSSSLFLSFLVKLLFLVLIMLSPKIMVQGPLLAIQSEANTLVP